MVPVGERGILQLRGNWGTFSHSNPNSFVWIGSELPITGSMQDPLSQRCLQVVHLTQ